MKLASQVKRRRGANSQRHADDAAPSDDRNSVYKAARIFQLTHSPKPIPMASFTLAKPLFAFESPERYDEEYSEELRSTADLYHCLPTMLHGIVTFSLVC
jgi:hypothetical protein